MTFKEYQFKLLEILHFFDELCRENGIYYTALDGTLLGTVRHKGFIPWDGDVDVALTPKELEKLKKVFSGYDGRYYLDYLPDHFYSVKGRKHNYRGLYARVVDKQCDSDIFGIDVFTIDFLGDDYKKAKRTIKKYFYYYKALRYTSSFHIPEALNKDSINLKRSVAICIYPIMKPLSMLLSPIFLKCYLKFRSSNIDCYSEGSKYFTIQSFLGRFGLAENSFLKNGYIDMPFEDMMIMVASGYEVYLRGTYGDYLKLPPENKRIPYPTEEALTSVNFID